MNRTPRVMILDHQGKSVAIADALRGRGCPIVEDPSAADVLLVDHDAPFHGRIPYMEACVRAGGRAFLYPHGAEATLMARWDGLAETSPLLSGALVTAHGHAEVARRFGYAHPVYPVGWSLCETRPRQAHGRTREILFAPMHPPWECGWNAPMFRRLIELPDVHVTVRYLGSLEDNALWHVPGVTYTPGEITDFAGMIDQIDAADVVVSPKGTFTLLAIARGVTTVTWRSDWAKDDSLENDAVNLDRYADYVRYPFDAEHADLRDTILAAAADTALFMDWRERFIGPPLDVDAMLAAFADAPRRRVIPPGPRAVVPGLTTDPAALHEAALGCVGDGRLDLARDLLAQALAHSVDPEILNDLAVVVNALGDAGTAASLLATCLVADPGHADAARNLLALGGEAPIGGRA